MDLFNCYNPQNNLLNPQIALKLEQGVNMGVIEPTAKEVKASSKVGLDLSLYPILFPDSNCDAFVTDFQPQFDAYFDTLGCNIFSGVKAIETNLNAMLIDSDYCQQDGRFYFSKRAACVAAGLDGTQGSSQAQFETMISTKGLTSELKWPFNLTMSQSEFFSQLSVSVRTDSLKYIKRFPTEFLSLATDKDSLNEALKYGAIKLFIATGFNWNKGEPYVIPRTANPMNHGVVLRYIDSDGYHIHDQYPPFKKVLAPDYRIFYAFQSLIKKKEIMDLINDNGTFWLVGDKGKIGIADPGTLTKFQQVTSQNLTQSTTNIPSVGVIKQQAVIVDK